MTTESKPGTRNGLSPLLGAMASGAAAVPVLVLVAALVDGRPAVVGAASGGVVTLVVFTLGIAVVGLVAAATIARVFVTVLPGLSTLDPATYAGVAMLMTGCASAAGLMGAWRLRHIAPSEALRAE